MRKHCSMIVAGLFLALVLVLLPRVSPSPAHAAPWTKSAQHISHHPLNCPELREGDQNDDVKTLQGKLNDHYDNGSLKNDPHNFNPPLDVDGIFGNNTRNAVLDFQIQRGLQVDGIVGYETWDALGGC